VCVAVSLRTLQVCSCNASIRRYVRTKGFLEEQAAGRILHPGAFAHSNSSGIMFNNPFTISVKNVANTGASQ